MAAAYAAEIPPETSATYPATEDPNPFYLFGLTGQQAAEQEMERLKKEGVRHQLPLNAVTIFCIMFAGIIDERMQECAKYKDDPKRLLTIYADQKLCRIVQSTRNYKITRHVSSTRHEVQHQAAKPGIGVRSVHWAENVCSCGKFGLEGIPCPHLVVVYKQTCPKSHQTMTHLLGELGGKIPKFYWMREYIQGYLQPVHLPALEYLVADDTAPPVENWEDRSLKRKKPWTERAGSARPKRAIRQSNRLMDLFSLHTQLVADAQEPERLTRVRAGTAAASADYGTSSSRAWEAR
jgi:hypothetical protein